MNKWPKCKVHEGYFPPTTIKERDSQVCRECEKEIQRVRDKAMINQYPSSDTRN